MAADEKVSPPAPGVEIRKAVVITNFNDSAVVLQPAPIPALNSTAGIPSMSF
jgi:hypothetical protein